MNLYTNNMPGPVCEGCLSVDRKLTPLLEDDSNFLFNQILFPETSINHLPLLCWECSALLQKFTKFKKQVKTAHENLTKYMHNETLQLHSLSNLAKCLNKVILFENHVIIDTFKNEVNETINRYSASEILKNKIPQILKSKNGLVKDSETNITFCSDIKGNKDDINIRDEANKTLPLAFVKIEENDSDICDELNYTLDEEDDVQKNDDISNSKLQFEPVASNIRKKRSRKKPVATEFDESDDEPLNIKKSKAAEDLVVAHKTRKKKKIKDDIKVDRRKILHGKRERPAGVIRNARVEKKLEQLNMGSEQLEMVVLSWEEVEAERTRAMASEAFTRHQYRCHDCVLGFNHKFKLDNHMKKHDPASAGGGSGGGGGAAATCATCRVVCRDARALAAHRRRHRVRWRCVTCGRTWSRAAVAADHAARDHGAPRPAHACALCGHAAPTLGKLRNHLKTHGERQKCELCGKTFSDRTSLRTHLFIHRGEKEHSCPRCGKRFLFKKAMQVHLVTHDAPAHLYCHQCDVNFKNQMSYYQHMKYNLKHIDPDKLKYRCGWCDKRFAKAGRLREHRAAVHLHATPERCAAPGCRYACSSRAVLRAHVRAVHRAAGAEGGARRNHVCHVCGKAYTTKKSLEGHLRAHSGERPFRCARCPSAFGYEAALYNHTRLVHLRGKTNRSRRGAQGPPVPPAPTAPTAPTAPSVSTLWEAPPTVSHTSAIS